MIVKIIGILLIVFSCGLWGVTKSAQLEKAVSFCSITCRMLNSISLMIRYNNYEIPEILHELCKNEECSEYISEAAVQNEKGMDFHTAWWKAVEKYVKLKPEREILLRFGNEFGLSDIDGQIKLIEGITAEINEVKILRTDEYNKYGRVYRTVGILFGLMAGVIII